MKKIVIGEFGAEDKSSVGLHCEKLRTANVQVSRIIQIIQPSKHCPAL